MNQILAEGGFAPEWIMLKRDIIEQQTDLRHVLENKCKDIFSKPNNSSQTKIAKGNKQKQYENPNKEWKIFCKEMQNSETLILLNKNIDKFKRYA